MKRRLLTIPLFLLAGAIVNVAVAWGCSLWCASRLASAPAVEGGVHVGEDGVWKVSLRQAFALRSVASWHLQQPEDPRLLELTEADSPSQVLPSWHRIQFPRAAEAGPMIVFQKTQACGWPCAALTWSWYTEGPDPSAPVLTELRSGIRAGGQSPGMFAPEKVLPLRPVWPGFAVNTFFYSVLLWLPYGGPSVLRRQIRRRRGRCPKCGYDLRGDLAAGCPECGWGREEAEA